jgi:hypothetical protein
VLVPEILLVALAVVAATALAVVVRRRLLQQGGGTLELSLRLKPHAPGRGWVLGIGRFADDELQWYRVFSLAPRPRRRFSRGELEVRSQRTPTAAETYALLKGAVVMECRSSDGPVQLGMDAAAVTGFLAWLEAQPPGATLPRA